MMGMMSMVSMWGIGKFFYMCILLGSYVIVFSFSKKEMVLRYVLVFKFFKVNGSLKFLIIFN